MRDQIVREERQREQLPRLARNLNVGVPSPVHSDCERAPQEQQMSVRVTNLTLIHLR